MPALRGGERRQRRGVAVGVAGHRRLDLARAASAGTATSAGSGIAGGVLVEVGGLVPAGHARAVLEAADVAHRSIPPRIGSSIASVAIRSAM